ncbi:magnesium/cobalt transporter CorA [Rubripirellula amarantea]|uniref:magnesium/cobalt transporter CorA n=1 Tax=Rubripirellula amarantea TaxID=2527999 RepID=UPI001A94BF33|nr:magnesium/cobalt transporter CorA [Rubripirellula amarantea]
MPFFSKSFLPRRRSRKRPSVVVGTVPGTLVEREGVARGKIRVIQYERRSHTDQTVNSVDQLDDLIGEAKVKPRRVEPDNVAGVETSKPKMTNSRPVTWINIDGVGDVTTLKELAKRFDIHPLALEDAANVYQHAKLECYGESLFFVVRMPTGNQQFETEQVSIFLLDDVVITIQEKPGDCFDGLRNRISNSLGRIRSRGADYLTYAIIDAVVDSYFPVLERYGVELDEISHRLEGTESRSLPLHLHEIRADLLSIRKTVNQHHKAINDLVREGEGFIAADTSFYFRDCQDHLQRLMEAADTDRETCGELRELYFAILGEKNNDVSKVLTIIATVFMPIGAVAGVYGMNFDSNISQFNMPELSWAFGYPFALLLMASMAGSLLTYLYLKGWLTH